MRRSRVSGHFVDGSKGPLFVLVREPGAAITGCVLVVPPFAEEMNKCRRMVTEVATRLAPRGLVVVTPDLYGTGDSGGDFADGDWAAWEQDLACVRNWCESRGLAITSLLAVRLGAALALSAMQQGALPAVMKTALWQPVFDGARHLGQFLRLRVAAVLMAEDRRESVTDLVARLMDGETLEVAGYRVSGALAVGLRAVTTPDRLPASLGRVHWMEVVRQPDGQLPAPSQALVERTLAGGGRVNVSAFSGEPFWSSTEIVCNAPIVSETASVLGSE